MRNGTAQAVIYFVLVIGIGVAAGGDGSTPGGTSAVEADQLTGITAQISAEVGVMSECLVNLTDTIESAEILTLYSVVKSTWQDAEGRWQRVQGRLAELVAARQTDSIRTMEILNAEQTDVKESQPAGTEWGLNTLSLEEEDATDGEALPRCVVVDLSFTLSYCAEVLDRVANQIFTVQTLQDLQTNNTHLKHFISNCTFHFTGTAQRDALLLRVHQVQDHVTSAEAALIPEQKPGVPLDSAYMVMFITFSVVLGVLLLTGLAVLSYKYAQTPNARRPVTRPATGATKSRSPGQQSPPAVAGYQNSAYCGPGVPRSAAPASVHETENWRWRRQSDVELRDGVEDDPVSTRQAKQSTMGRNWGGVVRDYERHSPTTRQSTGATQSVPRAHAGPRPGYQYDAARDPERRAADRQEERFGRSRRGDSDDYAWQESAPQRQRSPSPPSRPAGSHVSDGGQWSHPSKSNVSDGGQWSYGASGRQKSTDSPFQSAW